MAGQPLGIPNPATSSEATEGRAWWKVCCVGCCLGFIVIVLVVVFGVRLFTGRGAMSVKTLPTNYPVGLAFRPEEASEILYYPASSKGKFSALATIPLGWMGRLNREASSTAAVNAISSAIKNNNTWDTVSVHWQGLQTTRQDVMTFYSTALKEQGLYSVKTTNPNGTSDVHMTGTNERISFDLLMTDDPTKPGIDDMTVVVEYPVK